MHIRKIPQLFDLIPFHTFFTKRFGYDNGERIHFGSTTIMTGNNEDPIRDHTASYLELAEFIQINGAMACENLEQLWRRIVFNISILNTDDHLRNHGFILTSQTWILSPAYDVNPSLDEDDLALNIDMDNNALDYDLVLSVGDYFRLTDEQMNDIVHDVKAAIVDWEELSDEIVISKYEL
ncbi:type II toxin-antitoxin system HipA family toxin [Gelidibacter maritimus]|nr:HipA domain-containing protein [Gelidibacter maritimus]